MEWLSSLFLEHSALQAVVVLSLISAIGLGLGRVHFWGVSLGVTFVFFAGILAGHLGLSVDPQMLNYAEVSDWSLSFILSVCKSVPVSLALSAKEG